MSERTDAIAIANRILDEPGRDPDSDICVLARQLLRAAEEIEALAQGQAGEDL